MERVYIFDCDRIIGDEEKRTIIENMEGKAEVIFDNSEAVSYTHLTLPTN